jgi:hypothetical protein
MRLILFITLLQSITISCQSQNCSELPSSFSTFASAIEQIKKTAFRVEERCNTSSSSWITNAEYYSCDSKTGYLLISTAKKTYIYDNVPVEVWNAFKNAGSFGKYYTGNIKGRYRLELN